MRQLCTACTALSMVVLMLMAVTDAAAQTTLESFEDPGTLAHWINSTAGGYTLSGTEDGVEGSAIEIEYNLVADQGWGGSVDVQGEAADEYFPDMSEDTGISLYYRAVEPASDPANVNITIKLFENSTGETEEWHAVTTEVLGDDTGEWQELRIPFSEFAIPSWMTARGDEELQLDQVFQWQIQLFGTEGTTTTGTIMYDEFGSYGDDNGGGNGGGDEEVTTLIEELLARVESVVSGAGLWASHSSSMQLSLEAALEANTAGDVQGTLDALNTFINQADALRRLGGTPLAATRLPLSGRTQFRNVSHTALLSLRTDAEAIVAMLADAGSNAKMAGATSDLNSQTLQSESPRSFALNQNYPNPFNPTTLISYELPQASSVTLKVFNALGQEVMTLVDGSQEAGVHTARFEAGDLTSGLYIYQIQAGTFTQTKTMLLVR